MTRNKIFIFKYDPDCSIERMFAGFNQAVAGKLKSVEPNIIKSNNPEVLLSSINKNRWEIFTCLVEKKPNSLTELTQILKKDYRNVLRDIRILEGMGIVELKKENSEVKPVALYERIIFDLSAKKTESIAKNRIPLSLLH